jgi:hypothetical protein
VIDKVVGTVRNALHATVAAENAGSSELTVMSMPPMEPKRFVQAMARQVGKTLRLAAGRINDIPAGQISAARIDQLGDLFGELCWEALETGLQMRCNARGIGTTPEPEPSPPAAAPRRAEQAVPGKFKEVVLGLAEAVKDVLLDWSPAEETDADEASGARLPPVATAALVEAMRDKVEETLARLADAINEAPTAQAVVASEQRVWDLLAELLREALEKGQQLRIDAAVAALPPSPYAWVSRYRRMMATEGVLPCGQGPPPATAKPLHGSARPVS